MKTRKTLLAAALGIGMLSATGAHAALTFTLGGQGVYDTDLNITWLQDANLANTQSFGVSGITPGGAMTWNTAQSWIGAMNTANYLGFSDWRLSTVTDIGAPGQSGSWYDGTGDHGYNTASTGEMAHLWYDELGNKGYADTAGNYPQPGWGLTNTGPFSNVQSGYYWSGTEYALDSNVAWVFNTGNGSQIAWGKGSGMRAWAVRDGNSVAVSAVPEPATYAMLLAGLGLLGFTARRRSRS